MMTSSPFRARRGPRAGFTLVEMLAVLAIIAVLTGLGVAAFRGGSDHERTSGAADAASGVFAQARTQAIMRNTAAAVIVDTNTSSSGYYQRMMIVYLDTSVTASHPNPTWDQATPWISFPGNNYFDPIYSNPFGTLTLDSTTVPGISGSVKYAYYAFDATGQACLLPSTLAAGSPTTKATSTAAQFVVSPGSLSNGTFKERDSHSRYGFYLFPLGRMAFFQDVANDLSAPPANEWQ